MAITDAVLDEILKDYQKPEDLLGQNGLLKQLQKRLLEKAMGAELTVHLGYGKHDPAGRNTGNSRNGTSPKTLKGEFGNLELATPRSQRSLSRIVAKGNGDLKSLTRRSSVCIRDSTHERLKVTCWNLRGGGVCGVGVAGDRSGVRRCAGVAESAVGGGLPDRLF
jgi:hypothetical protein